MTNNYQKENSLRLMLEDMKSWSETAKEPRAKSLIEFINFLQGKMLGDVS